MYKLVEYSYQRRERWRWEEERRRREAPTFSPLLTTIGQGGKRQPRQIYNSFVNPRKPVWSKSDFSSHEICATGEACSFNDRRFVISWLSVSYAIQTTFVRLSFKTIRFCSLHKRLISRKVMLSENKPSHFLIFCIALWVYFYKRHTFLFLNMWL